MNTRFITAALTLFAVSTAPACGSKEGEAGGEAAAADNTFAKRKASIDAYMAVVEGAGDIDKAIAAGQAWIDANLAAYTANCKVLVVDRQDLKKSADADKFETVHGTYMLRIGKIGNIDMENPDMEAMKKSGELRKQISSFWNCDTLVKAN